jgi:hypothetical protein
VRGWYWDGIFLIVSTFILILIVSHFLMYEMSNYNMPSYLLWLLPGYSEDSSGKLPVNPNTSAVPPRPAPGPNSYTPEAAKGAAPNGTQVNALEPSACYSQQELFSANVFIATALLFALII